ncbi:MAG TPA: helix-turn-helix transcriptional regulator [Bacteroidales bacterium]|nr:helix-turn-helix transcriptional regulator [Bacteroidales bacterium]
MKDRIIEFLRAENKSSAQFAEEIGVQPSGISHILSGRNNPSLDFVLKMLDRYKFISTEWLLFGKGTMYKDSGGMQSLFDQTLFDQKPEAGKIEKAKSSAEKSNTVSVSPDLQDISVTDKKSNQKSGIDRIVWFYSDGSFEDFYPRP